MKQPWITCVCVSKARPTFLKRAIGLFLAQTYPNKDLVIVYEGDDESLKFDEFPDELLTVIRIENGSSLTLGERRNISIEHCRGEFFCQWDDDDWYHNRRLELQLSALQQNDKPACVLNRLILYDGIGGGAYLSSERYWEGTLLCYTKLITEGTRYPHVNRSEDYSLVVSLVGKDHVYALSAPYLYVYFYHGGNTWGQSHFNQLFQAGYPLDDAAKTLKNLFLNDGQTDASEEIQRLNLNVFH